MARPPVRARREAPDARLDGNLGCGEASPSPDARCAAAAVGRELIERVLPHSSARSRAMSFNETVRCTIDVPLNRRSARS